MPDAMLGGQYEYGFQSFQTENPYGGAAVFDISFGAKKDNSRFNMIDMSRIMESSIRRRSKERSWNMGNII